MQQNRTTQRKLVGLLVKLAHKGLDEFASKYATNLSDGGMFIRTREPKPIGTELSFKVEIADGQRVLQGTAVVRWTRPDNDPGGPPGMGLEFLTLDPASRALVDRMMGHAAAVAPPSIAPAVSALPDEDEPFTMTAPVQAGAPVPAVPPVSTARAPATRPVSTPVAAVAPSRPASSPSPLVPPVAPALHSGAAPHAAAPSQPAPRASAVAPTQPPAAPHSGASPHAVAPSHPPAAPHSGAAPHPVAPSQTAPRASTVAPTQPPAAPQSGTAPHAVGPSHPAPRASGVAPAPFASQVAAAQPSQPAAAPPQAAARSARLDAQVAPGVASSRPAAAPAPSTPGAEMEFELPIEDADLFSASAEVDLERSVEVDLDVLLGSTPAPTVPITSSDSGIAIDLEPLEQAEPLPSTPLDAPELPTIRRAPATPAPAPAAAPVVLDAKAATLAPATPQQAGPVYLRDVKAAETTGPVIGIDLGTTNSACAVLTKGRPIILSSKDGYNTIPSVVALTAQNRLLIGHRAKSQLVLNPTQSIFGAKRLVGREFDSPTVKQVKERSHYEIVAGADRRAAVRLGDKVLSLEEVQALVLKECREMAEQALGVPVSRAVITCPAYYSEPQREAVRRAGAMAGLKVERVLNEPTAAALAFGMGRELKKTVLVYDLGGGTFDATLLKVDQNVFEVLATGGDVFLGGTDFDNQVVDLLLRRFQDWHKRPFSGDRVALSRVAEVAEKVKIALSEQKSFDVHLPMLEMDGSGKPLDLRTTVTRGELEEACRELVDRTIQAVQDVLLDAKLKATQIDDIILVGGMSRMPLVRDKLKELFKKPAHASVNADEAVALGAALYSGTVDKVSSLVLIDVVPMTIGLGRPGGAFHRLIERNTPLPATKSFGLSTQKDDETELEVMVFQGEDSNVAGNEFLGAVTISGLPKGPKGSVQVAVTLGLDAECVLRVEAREFKTRQVVRATLATRYTSEEIAQRLGITAEKREAVNKSRTEELEKRAGGFWGKLKSLFKR